MTRIDGVKGHIPRVVRRSLARAHRGLVSVQAVLRVGARPVRSLRSVRNADLERAFPRYREQRARLLAVAVGLFLAALVGALLAARFVDGGLAALIAGVVVVSFLAEAAHLAWRGRIHRGRGRGLPPGSVGVGPESMIDPQHFSRALRRHGVTFKSNHFLAPMVCIADLESARALLRVHADDLAGVPLPFDRFVPGGLFRWADGAVHSNFRRLILGGLAPPFVPAWRPTMARRSSEQLGALAEEARVSGAGVAPMPVLEELMLQVWSEILLGIPRDAPEYAEVRSIFSDLRIYNPQPPADDEVVAQLDRLAALVRGAHEHAADVSPAVGTGPVSLATALARIQADALEQPGSVRNLLYMTITSRDDVVGLLRWLFKDLADNPTWVDQVRDAADGGPELTARIVSETLRLDQSEYIFRQARREIRFNDVVIPAGWMVRVCIREIHRDPATFPDADHFDPTRFENGGCGREVYAPFGIDQRACVGETLARTMASAFVTELVHGFDFETIVDGPLELSRYRHWAPSSSWRVSIRPRVAAVAGSATSANPA